MLGMNILNCLIYLLREADMNISEILIELRKDSNFEIVPACGQPILKEGHILPKDLKEFFDMCGGISCYINNGGFPIDILSPSGFKQANELLLGSGYEDDISSSWYTIVDAKDGNYITIDCNKVRLGKCYESFEYSHAVSGNCPIIALSFTELLNNIFKYKGDYFYWKDNGKIKLYGDAYDAK